MNIDQEREEIKDGLAAIRNEAASLLVRLVLILSRGEKVPDDWQKDAHRLFVSQLVFGVRAHAIGDAPDPDPMGLQPMADSLADIVL